MYKHFVDRQKVRMYVIAMQLKLFRNFEFLSFSVNVLGICKVLCLFS